MNRKLINYLVLLALIASWPAATISASAQPADNPAPPETPMKLIFIHHSTGGNWLADPTSNELGGGLGRALMENNYFVSATNYGWGPDGVGDRTDIVNWPEWFTGSNRDGILAALYAETGQNFGDFGEWPRLPGDPGGENQIILFKSCFPNSNLGGSPSDPPAAAPNEDLTVSNAKAIYNDLLTYFVTRQDKLFIVITAPPLADFDTSAANAANARALNNWLVNDWLSGYTYPNVAVFDYYNVLTSGPSASRNDAGQAAGNHHRWWEGAVQHIQTVDNNFLVYPSGDSHPSRAGNEKAAAEFVPLLNVYYNRWKAGAPIEPPAPTQPAVETSPTEEPIAPTMAPEEPVLPAPSGNILDDFEAGLFLTSEGDNSKIDASLDPINPHSGSAALLLAYDVEPGGWGGIGRSYDTPQDWSRGDGIVLWIRSEQAGQYFTLNLFSGDPAAPTPFVVGFESSDASVSGWQRIDFPWIFFARADWADDAGLTELDITRITGYAITFGDVSGERNANTLWLDDITLLTDELADQSTPTLPPARPTATEEIIPEASEAPVELDQPTETVEIASPEEPVPTDTPTASKSSRGGPCPGPVGIVAATAIAGLIWKRKETR